LSKRKIFCKATNQSLKPDIIVHRNRSVLQILNALFIELKWLIVLAFFWRDNLMLKNYLKIAFRNLWRTKGFSLINITGLAIGMASAIFILLWIQNEMSYDQFHKNKPYLYEAWNRSIFDGKLQCWNNTPKILGPTLKKDYPQIAEVARAATQMLVTNAGDKKMTTRALVVDPSFLNMFSFTLLRGNPQTALNNMNAIVITEEMAKKTFGNEEAMNKTISIDKVNFKVTGILTGLPTNTAFDFEYLLPWAYLTAMGEDDNYWGNNSVDTYVQLKPNITEAEADAKIVNITKRHSNNEEQQEVFLHPITKWHLYSNFQNGKIAGGMIDTIRIFAIIAVLILLIACINFMNLSTARSEKRAKEVGIRKVSGAHQGLLIGQFLGESILIALIAGAAALLLVQLFIKPYDELVGKVLALPYHSIYFWIAALGFVLVTGLIAGSYPAFILSSFKPVDVLKGSFKKAHAFINPRKILVVLQFTFATVLIICTFIVMQELRYAQNRDSGYDQGQLVYHWMTGEMRNKYPLIRSELLASGAASSVTATSWPITDNYSDSWGFQWQGKAPNDRTDFLRTAEDEGLVRTAGLKLIRGRDMDLKEFPTDSGAMILNESAAKEMGFKDPIGQIVIDGDKTYHVIGVIKDFIVGSPYDFTRPMIIEGTQGYISVINMRLTAHTGTAKDLAAIEKIFKKFNPDYPFEYHFVDKEYARKFESTQRVATLIGLFGGLTIFISCLGLFGLATFMAENRIKEIGVRKVLGASVFRITTLLSEEFLSLVILSILIATPIAWYLMNGWLHDFPYRIHMEWWVFVLAGGLSVLISLITVGYQTIRAAVANPVKSLRAE
jgi:putative ABC transport system permease protein